MFAKTLSILSLAAAVAIGVPVLAEAAGPQARQSMAGAGSMGSAGSMAGAGSTAVAIAALTAEEAADLTFMREEEKLARDLYLTFEEAWGSPPFALIASAEQRHMDAILRKLIKYRLPDPAAGNVIGEFTSPQLQALYDEHSKEGLTSELAALSVGGFIEELDIRDNEEAAAGTTKEDLDRVYEALTCGSRNHLRAFAARITMLTGAAYVAQYLPQVEVDAILQQSWEFCGSR